MGAAEWKKHAIVVGVLIGALVPAWFLDQALLAPSGGNWIQLDFRGLFVELYIAWLVVHVCVTSAAIGFFKQRRVLALHLAGAPITAAGVALGALVLLSSF